jgi:6,7-dimethyl-8-ribityllumazine synthase
MKKSLPNLDTDSVLTSQTNKVAIVKAKWNEGFNDEMTKSCQEELFRRGLAEKNLFIKEVPGAFEIPFAVNYLIGNYDLDLIIVIATIIRGETYHFEIVANESARGIMNLMLTKNFPIINGILTVNTEGQARARASIAAENKGKELALSAVMILNDFSKKL